MIIYFSGTGNSEYVAQRLATMTGDQAVNLFGRIKGRDYSALHSERPWVVVAPAYAWKLPWIVEEYLQKTELAGNNRIYYVLTCGDSVAGAGRYAAELSGEIGKKYMGLVPVVMPENYIAMFPVPDREESLQIIDDAEESICRLAKYISEGKEFNAKAGSRFMSSVINWIFFKFITKDKKFTVDEKCNGCGKCADVCPLNNVEISGGKPAWKGHCTHCMRCICLCPMEAIEYGNASRGKWRYNCPAKADKNSSKESENEITFEKATEADIPEISRIYDRIHNMEESGRTTIGWNRDIYPTRETAEEAVDAGEMFVAKVADKIVAAARINKEQVHPAYDEIDWKYKAEDDKVLVIHTLVVNPEVERQGTGKAFVKFYEGLAVSEGCTALRLDTNERNMKARNMYKSLGYNEAGIAPCVFNGIPGVNLVCLEKEV